MAGLLGLSSSTDLAMLCAIIEIERAANSHDHEELNPGRTWHQEHLENATQSS